MTWILDQHLLAEVYALLADHQEQVRHKVGLFVLDHFESLSLFMGLEGEHFADHEVHDDAQGPHVDLFVIRLLEQNFRCHVGWGATAVENLVAA